MANNIISFLERTYLEYPEKCACADENSRVSYRELWEDSHIIASNLLNDADVERPIPIFMKKSCATLKVIWGIIKAGGCYVFIDVSLPEERIQSILNVLDAECIIGEYRGEEKLPKNIKIFHFEELLTCKSAESQKTVEKRIEQICDIDPLYIMFTSGSTGTPKGIVANHRSVIDFIEHFSKIFNISNEDVIGNQAPWDFDVSVKDIFTAAKTGATLQIIPKKYFSLPAQLVEYLDNRKITTLIWAVSALCIISSRGMLTHKRPKYIQKIIFSGEVMPVRQYNIWKNCYPNAVFANVYGPTEITCNCTYFFVERIYDENETIPIGEAFPNERVFLFDDNDCKIEKTTDEKSRCGEICVQGTAVTMGYYNNFDSTYANFVQNPLNSKYTDIIYRTGDIGYYNEEGQLCYLSRKDYQVKHMGHRIELAEIEKVLNALDEINMCCCIYCHNEIVIFYEGMIEVNFIKSVLRKKLPVYMIPGKIINVEKMPLNKNGKIDRRKLAEYLEVQ